MRSELLLYHASQSDDRSRLVGGFIQTTETRRRLVCSLLTRVVHVGCDVAANFNCVDTVCGVDPGGS